MIEYTFKHILLLVAPHFSQCEGFDDVLKLFVTETVEGHQRESCNLAFVQDRSCLSASLAGFGNQLIIRLRHRKDVSDNRLCRFLSPCLALGLFLVRCGVRFGFLCLLSHRGRLIQYLLRCVKAAFDRFFLFLERSCGNGFKVKFHSVCHRVVALMLCWPRMASTSSASRMVSDAAASALLPRSCTVTPATDSL